MEMYLIRHTSVAVAPGLCYGQTDVPLAHSFETEYRLVRQKLPEHDHNRVYSSPLTRCRTLAERLGTGQMRLDPRLMEMHFGDWEQRAWEDIDETELTAWMTHFVQQRCAGGESYQEVFARAVAFWQDLMQDQPGQGVIVTHGGVIRALLAYLLDLPLANVMRIGIDFGSVTKIRQTDYGPVVEYINR